MPVQFRGSLFYENGKYGWTENYWLDATDMATACTKLGVINDAGMACRSSPVKLVYARVSDAVSPRVSFDPDTSAWQQAGTYVPVGGTVVLSPHLALLLRTYSSDYLSRSRIYFRGVPAEQVGTTAGGPDVTFTFTAPFTTALTALKAAIIANALMVHKTAAHAFSSKPISTVVEASAAHIRRAGRPFELPVGHRLVA